MSFQITTAFVQQYADNVAFLAQQGGSRLANAVAVDPAVKGEYGYYDQIGVMTYNNVVNRNGDSPLNVTPFSRRQVHLQDYDTGDLVDKLDKLKMLIDPQSGTAKAIAMTMGRAKDDVIIASFFATANTGKTGGTPVSFPSGNIIAVNDRTYQDQGNAASGNSSLTVSKLISAKTQFFTGNVNMDDEFYVGANGQSIAALLTATPVTSIWYNSVRPLVDGAVDTFMGFTFIRTELVIKNGLGVSLQNGSSQNLIPVWAKTGIQLAIGQDIVSEVAIRPDKRFSAYVYYCMSLGATRMEEVKVCQLICDPTKTN